MSYDYGNYVNHFGYTGTNHTLAAMAEYLHGRQSACPGAEMLPAGAVFAATRSAGHPGRNHLVIRAATLGARTVALTGCGKVLARPLLHSDPENHLELCDDCALADYRRPTVYRFFADDDALLYVGCSTAFDLRVRGHMTASEWWPEVARATWVEYDDAAEAFAAECLAIETEQPRYNKQLARSAA